MLDTFRVVELGGHTGLTSGPAGKALLEEIEKSAKMLLELQQKQQSEIEA